MNAKKIAQPIIHEPFKEAKRIKVFIPYQMFAQREAVKKMDSSFWHPNQRLWSVINTKENFELLVSIFKPNFLVKKDIRFYILNTHSFLGFLLFLFPFLGVKI